MQKTIKMNIKVLSNKSVSAVQIYQFRLNIISSVNKAWMRYGSPTAFPITSAFFMFFPRAVTLLKGLKKASIFA